MIDLTLPQQIQRLADQLAEVEKDLAQQAKFLDEFELERYTTSQTVENLETDYNNNYRYHFQFLVETETVDGKPDGKKKFSNKDLRDIEVARRLSQDEGAQDLLRQIADAKEAKFRADRNNFQCRDRIKDLGRQHSGIVAMLHVYAELIHTNTRMEERNVV